MSNIMPLSRRGAAMYAVVMCVLLPHAACMTVWSDTTDYAGMLEQECRNKFAPFLAGNRGAIYVAGASLPPSTDHDSEWPIFENETIGFTHAFFRDGRARGEAIVTDEMTGTGHSMWGWEFWRNTKIAYGSVSLSFKDGSTYEIVTPAPSSLRWRPDRLTATYDVGYGVTITETKFIDSNDVLVDSILVTKNSTAAVKANWQELNGYGCDNGGRPLFTVPSVSSPAQCEAICANNTQCVQWQLAIGGKVCWGYSSRKSPTKNPSFDCGCLNSCEVGPSPGPPGPPGPPSPPPSNATVTGVVLTFSGSSYVNTKSIPTNDGDPPNTPNSQQRNSVAHYDTTNNAIIVSEKGTAYAKTAYCTQVLDKPNYQELCKAKVGPMMYDGMSVVLSATQPMLNTSVQTDQDKRQLYNFSIEAPFNKEVSISWAMDDDLSHALVNTKAALNQPSQSLLQVTNSVNQFLQQDVPYFRGPGNSTTVYYYSWALYYMYTVDSKMGWESIPHTQTAVNNFLGLHAYDSRVYLPMGSWIKNMSYYSYGNALIWARSLPFTGVSISNGSSPDNMGHAWISPMNCSAVSGHPEGVWQMVEHGADANELVAPAYEYYLKMFGPNAPANINGLGGIGANNAEALMKMAVLLNRSTNEIEYWNETNYNIMGYIKLMPPSTYKGGCGELQYLYSKFMNSSWSTQMSKYWAEDRSKCWQNQTIPLLLTQSDDPSQSHPFEVSTIVTYWSIEGLFRHDVASAVDLTLAHVNAMLSTYGDVVFPESWDNYGEPWGDQYYNWDGAVSLLLLERFAGISYSVVDSIFTVRDYLPDSWPFVEVVVPVMTSKGVQSVHVVVNRTSNNGKTITVTGNPLSTLRVEPWMGSGHSVSSASPSGFNTTSGLNRVNWTFTETQAESVQVQVQWK